MSPAWLIWQLADSALPSGAFGHSAGLEAAVQHGEVQGADSLLHWTEVSLINAGTSMLPFVTAGFDDPSDLPRIDSLCDAWLSNHVANRASRAQGRAFHTAARHAFPLPFLPAPDPGHWAPTFGAITSRLRVTRATAVRLFLFLHLRGMLSAAVRLGIVGPLQAQCMQHRLGPAAEDVARRCSDLGLEDAVQLTPLPDILQAAHDRLYSRLFQS